MALSTFEVPIRSFVLLALVAFTPARLTAQSSQTVPPDDPVYQFVDKLVAARLIDTILIGQRTMSRREMGRVVAEARRRLAADTGWLGSMLAEYSVSYPAVLARAPLVMAFGIDAVVAESPSRGIEPDANGAISVVVNPLLSNQLGRPLANGVTAAGVGEVGAGVAPWLTVHVRARVSGLDNRANEGDAIGAIEQVYARGVWKNAAVLVGRDHLFLGQGNTAGLTASLNPRGLNQVRLSTDRPFVLPSLLRHIGPIQAIAALGDLGPGQFYPHSRLFAYKVSALPHRAFEIGASLAEEVGGEGAPAGTFLQKAGDAFPLLDALFLHRNTFFSNKFVSVDLRYRIPWTRGLQFYAEGAFDDFDIRRVRSVFTEDGGYVWGASMSCFAECGPVRATVEYHVTGLRFYTHGAFRSGFTVDNQFLGDQLGPRGKGGYGTVDIDRGGSSTRISVAHEARSGDKFGSITTTTDDSDFRFVRLERNPTERRWRITTSLRRDSPNGVMSYRVGAGAERAENFRHVSGVWRTNWMTQFGIEYRPAAQFAR